MRWFRGADVTVRCVFRGAVLAAPPSERVVAACAEAERGRLRRRLAKIRSGEWLWSVHWAKERGDDLRPRDIVAVLRGEGVAVELVSARHGVVGEIFAAEGERVAAEARLARIGKPLVAISRGQKAAEVMAQLTSRHHRDLEEIKRLQAQLEEERQLIVRLRDDNLALRARQSAEHLGARLARGAPDARFRRLKLEFSKRFHPDGGGADTAERQRRERVFQEFWPILEQIERS